MTTITPSVAIDRIIASGYNPLQFTYRAYRDNSMSWATEFEMLAHLNNCFGMNLSPSEAIAILAEEVNLRQFVIEISKSSWLWQNHMDWFMEISRLVFAQ